jgi:hypothetical protein
MLVDRRRSLIANVLIIICGICVFALWYYNG